MWILLMYQSWRKKAVKQESKKANIISWYQSHWAEFYILIIPLQVSVDVFIVTVSTKQKKKKKKDRKFKINQFIVKGKNLFLFTPTMIYNDSFLRYLLFKVPVRYIFLRILGFLTAEFILLQKIKKSSVLPYLK